MYDDAAMMEPQRRAEREKVSDDAHKTIRDEDTKINVYTYMLSQYWRTQTYICHVCVCACVESLFRGRRTEEYLAMERNSGRP